MTQAEAVQNGITALDADPNTPKNWRERVIRQGPLNVREMKSPSGCILGRIFGDAFISHPFIQYSWSDLGFNPIDGFESAAREWNRALGMKVE